jgi:hypothetical protein
MSFLHRFNQHALQTLRRLRGKQAKLSTAEYDVDGRRR